MRSAVAQLANIARQSIGLHARAQQHGDGKEEAAEPPTWARALMAQMQSLQSQVHELRGLHVNAAAERSQRRAQAEDEHDVEEQPDAVGDDAVHDTTAAVSNVALSSSSSRSQPTVSTYSSSSSASASQSSPHLHPSPHSVLLPLPSSASSSSSSSSSSASPALSRWLSWAGNEAVALRALAQCLPFADGFHPFLTRDADYRSSFLSLARTCRSAYALLTSDAACWSTQRLLFDMGDGLLHEADFVPRYESWPVAEKHILLCERFTARRQETLRRLLEHDTYNRLVARLTAYTQYERFSYSRDKDAHYRVERDRGGQVWADACLDFTVRSLAIDELQLLGLYTRRREAEWLYCCFSYLLLPRCIAPAPAAHILLTERYYQSNLYALYRLLQC